MSTTTVCFINQKGGCGKSSSCYHVGGALAGRGLRTLLVDADPRDPQNLGKQSAQHRLLRAARAAVRHPPTQLRHRQRTAVQLAVRRQRQPIQLNDRRRHHVLRQHHTQRRPQPRRINRSARRTHHVADQPRLTRAVLPRHHRGLRHAILPQQHSLDLARLDPEPAQLHLRVGPAQELQHPVRAPPRQVPGPVHPRAGHPMRVRNKALRRQSRTRVIAPRKPEPPAPWPRRGLGILTWPAYKLCEPHTVLLGLSIMAIVAVLSPSAWLAETPGIVRKS